MAYIIATEKQAAEIGGRGRSYTNDLAVTKVRAIALGCKVANASSYSNSLLVKYVDLSKGTSLLCTCDSAYCSCLTNDDYGTCSCYGDCTSYSSALESWYCDRNYTHVCDLYNYCYNNCSENYPDACDLYVYCSCNDQCLYDCGLYASCPTNCDEYDLCLSNCSGNNISACDGYDACNSNCDVNNVNYCDEYILGFDEITCIGDCSLNCNAFIAACTNYSYVGDDYVCSCDYTLFACLCNMEMVYLDVFHCSCNSYSCDYEILDSGCTCDTKGGEFYDYYTYCSPYYYYHCYADYQGCYYHSGVTVCRQYCEAHYTETLVCNPENGYAPCSCEILVCSTDCNCLEACSLLSECSCEGDTCPTNCTCLSVCYCDNDTCPTNCTCLSVCYCDNDTCPCQVVCPWEDTPCTSQCGCERICLCNNDTCAYNCSCLRVCSCDDDTCSWNCVCLSVCDDRDCTCNTESCGDCSSNCPCNDDCTCDSTYCSCANYCTCDVYN